MSNVTQKTIEDWGLQEDHNRVSDLIGILKKNADQRWDAAWALGQLKDRCAVQPLIGVLGDSDANVRKRAAYSLGEIGGVEAVEPLYRRREDTNRYVRQGVDWALNTLDPKGICFIQRVVFGTCDVENKTELSKQYRSLQNPESSEIKVPMLSLQRVEVYADSSDDSLLGEFVTYTRNHLTDDRRNQVTVFLNGDFSRLGSQLAELQKLFNTVKLQVEGIVFGEGEAEIPGLRHVIQNPDFTHVTTASLNLQRLVVYADTIEKRILNDFSKYAGNHLQNRNIPTVVYGDPQKLGEETYKKLEKYCQWDYDLTEVILFGKGDTEISNTKIALWNPDLQKVKSPMLRLGKVVIWQQNDVFHLVERSITEISNKLSQSETSNKLSQSDKHDKQVEVSWPGDSNDRFENIRREVKKDAHFKSV